MRKAGQSMTRDDAPTLDVADEFWSNAQVVTPSKKKSVRLELDEDVFAYFEQQGKGHILRMQAVLKAYVEAHQDGKTIVN